MRIYSKFLLFILVLLSCDDSDSDTLNCKVVMAKSGYAPPGANPVYYFDYNYTYEGNKLKKFEQISIDGQNNNSTIELQYDSKGRVIRETSAGSFPEYKDYKYFGRYVNIKMYGINNSDTINFSESQYIQIENPEDKVYHDTFNKACLKFKNGNVVEHGYYEVSGVDTVDTFYERYSYDNHSNYFTQPEYRLIIPSDAIWAKITSKNNLTRIQYITGAYDFSYIYTYDDNNRLIHHYGKSGITVDFEYKCD